ncbi:hypothetical protein NKR19_g2862 [Coniochaeta hoffmannii]|uniref:Cytochrome c oxidase assembly protein n=1 Tax=Coniochaeta hoffmannii TaxID=91930 RepID=A0AA38W1Z4_9PEZI|nr:hypothetical protein NKR19_g2862 [Coniochaeta hoffmannii]
MAPPRVAAAKAASSASASAWPRYKRMVWTGAFAAVTFVGTIYGAGLKTRMEYKEEKKKLTEAPLDDRVDALETRRGQLLTQRAQLERKLAELRRKMADEPEGRDAGAGSGDGGK